MTTVNPTMAIKNPDGEFVAVIPYGGGLAESRPNASPLSCPGTYIYGEGATLDDRARDIARDRMVKSWKTLEAAIEENGTMVRREDLDATTWRTSDQ